MKILSSTTQCKCCQANIQYDGGDVHGWQRKYIVCPVCGVNVYPGI